MLAIRPDGTLSYDFSEGDEDEGEGSYELRSGMILFREPGKSKVVAWTYHFDRKGLLYLHMEDSAEVYVFVRQTNTR